MTQVFGEIYAPVYDLVYRDKDYSGETDLLERVFRQYSKSPVKNILDLGCGTGNHALDLAARGYAVVGADGSAEMLKVANQKAREQARNVRFHQADIRHLHIGETFDAVLMMFAVLGYQLEDADVLGALQTARRHLYLGGLFIFDVWYGPAVLAQGTQQRLRTARNKGETWIRTSSGQLETSRNLCHVKFHLKQLLGDELRSETIENHTVRYFFAEEMDRFLKEAGFRLLQLGAFPIFDHPPNDATWNVMAVSTAV